MSAEFIVSIILALLAPVIDHWAKSYKWVRNTLIILSISLAVLGVRNWYVSAYPPIQQPSASKDSTAILTKPNTVERIAKPIVSKTPKHKKQEINQQNIYNSPNSIITQNQKGDNYLFNPPDQQRTIDPDSFANRIKDFSGYTIIVEWWEERETTKLAKQIVEGIKKSHCTFQQGKKGIMGSPQWTDLIIFADSTWEANNNPAWDLMLTINSYFRSQNLKPFVYLTPMPDTLLAIRVGMTP